MNEYGYALLGMTALVAMLVAVVTFAVLRFAAGARDATRHLRDSGSDTALLSAALQDAVARLKAQEQATSARAAASEQLSDQIVASLTAGLLVVDRHGRVEILNPAGRRLLGTAHDPIGSDYRELLRAAPPLADFVAECLARPAPVARRELHVPGAARASHLGVTVSPLGGEEHPRGLICLFADLTNVFELEEQLRLKETLARLGELTAGMAHEFRNGLATIHGYSRLIDPQAVPAAYAPYVEGIRQEAEALGHVVTNFLNFARPEKLSLSRVPLEPLARKLAEDLHAELGVAIEVSGELGEIAGDDVMLRQALGNLVRNAVEACTEAGVRPAVRIQGEVDRERLTCRVTVSDNGPGIPEAARARVFQPFFTTRARGTGLGLAIVQKIAIMHNGRVALGDPAPAGAAVHLTFPLA